MTSCVKKTFVSTYSQQECIPVGCVPPASWPHLIVSGRGGGACLGGMHARGACVPGDVHTWGACILGACVPGGRGCVPHPSVDRILDKRLWKHYLPATTVAGGNENSRLGNFCKLFNPVPGFWNHGPAPAKQGTKLERHYFWALQTTYLVLWEAQETINKLSWKSRSTQMRASPKQQNNGVFLKWRRYFIEFGEY